MRKFLTDYVWFFEYKNSFKKKKVDISIEYFFTVRWSHRLTYPTIKKLSIKINKNNNKQKSSSDYFSKANAILRRYLLKFPSFQSKCQFYTLCLKCVANASVSLMMSCALYNALSGPGDICLWNICPFFFYSSLIAFNLWHFTFWAIHNFKLFPLLLLRKRSRSIIWINLADVPKR